MSRDSWKYNNTLREANESRLNALADRLEDLADELRALASEGEKVSPAEVDKKVTDIVTDYAIDDEAFLKKGADKLLGQDAKGTIAASLSWAKDAGDSIRKGGAVFQATGVDDAAPKADKVNDYDDAAEETAEEYKDIQDDFVEPAAEESEKLGESRMLDYKKLLRERTRVR